MKISPDVFEANLRPQHWVEDADLRRAVDWLSSFLKPAEWKARRFAAFTLFIESASGERKTDAGKGRFFDEKDRFAWYLLLGENWLERPELYDYVFGSRVIPVFIAIGQNLDALKAVAGVNERVRRMVTKEKAQPNACLFELLVAASYLREGGVVSFLEEKPGVGKTHDMDVELRGVSYAVECKRLETGDYTEAERDASRRLWVPVSSEFERLKMDVRCDVDYITELRTVPPTYLASKAQQWLSKGALLPLTWSDEHGVGAISRLNLVPLQTELERSRIASNSTRVYELLLGGYRRNAKVISALRIKRADNPLYMDACTGGTVCNWRSLSPAATESKARDVIKRVSDGCAQIADGRRGVVHIGLEAVDGDEVEEMRYAKVTKSLTNFDPRGKNLEYVYVHWLAPESPPNKAFDFNETRHLQAILPKSVAPIEGFLVLPKGARKDSRRGGHWRQPA